MKVGPVNLCAIFTIKSFMQKKKNLCTLTKIVNAAT